MGYQESIIRVNNISEVVGIARAVDESEELKTLEYLVCFGAARAKKPLYWGHQGGRPLSEVKEGERPIINEGDLFATVGGARLYQIYPCYWLDCVAGISEEGFHAQFDEMPLGELLEHAGEDVASEKRGEAMMRRLLNCAYTSVMKGDCPIELPEEFRVKKSTIEAQPAAMEPQPKQPRRKYQRSRKVSMEELCEGQPEGKVGKEWAGSDVGAEAVE